MSEDLQACPCCGYATLTTNGEYEICAICFWEDDGQGDAEATECWGGPNWVSLAEGRANFLKMGASDPKDARHCRKPTSTDVQLRTFRFENGSVNEPIDRA